MANDLIFPSKRRPETYTSREYYSQNQDPNFSPAHITLSQKSMGGYQIVCTMSSPVIGLHGLSELQYLSPFLLHPRFKLRIEFNGGGKFVYPVKGFTGIDDRP